MAVSNRKQTNYVGRMVGAVEALVNAMQGLETLYQEGQLVGFVQAPDGPAGTLTDSDFVGDLDYLDAATFAQCMGALGTLDGLLHQGTSLATILRLRR